MIYHYERSFEIIKMNIALTCDFFHAAWKSARDVQWDFNGSWVQGFKTFHRQKQSESCRYARYATEQCYSNKLSARRVSERPLDSHFFEENHGATVPKFC